MEAENNGTGNIVGAMPGPSTACFGGSRGCKCTRSVKLPQSRSSMNGRDRVNEGDGWESTDDFTNRTMTIRCDAIGCHEAFPVDHDLLGEPSFATGRWLGWIFIDINRPDLLNRELRFCSTSCASWWFDREAIAKATTKLTPLDQAIRAPYDETARKRAGLGKAS